MRKQPENMSEKQELKRSICPVSCVLDILGDRWTLLVVRDMFLGKKTYSDFQKSPEGIPTNILAERLKRLEKTGIIQRARYQERPPRYAYTMTKKGWDLAPVIEAMMKWGNQHIPGTFPTDDIRQLLSNKVRESTD